MHAFSLSMLCATLEAYSSPLSVSQDRVCWLFSGRPDQEGSTAAAQRPGQGGEASGELAEHFHIRPCR